MKVQAEQGRRILALLGTLGLLGCGSDQVLDPGAPPPFGAFGSPQRVTIRGYTADAMEPFLTKDGRFLLFNNRNDPSIDTKLQYAERVNELTFDYRGEIGGANTPSLEGVPSMDRLGNIFFVSTRSYGQTLSTLYRGRFAAGAVTGVELVPGISRLEPGIVMFDAEISADGGTLLVVDGRFTGGNVPVTANIDIAVPDGNGFRRLPGDLLRNVNTGALEYAPAISTDLLELFFTRLDNSGPAPATEILRAARASTTAAFGVPQRIASITGFVEGPTLSNDGRSLYYHLLDGNRFVIQRVAR